MSALLVQISNHLIQRAKPIVDAMLISKSLLRWNRDFELVIKDDIIPNTNVPELISHALLPINMKDRPPNGFSKFVKVLAILGLESQYVENEYAEEILDGSESSSDSDSSSDSSDDESDAEMEEEDNNTGSSSDEERDAKREEEETGSASNEKQDAKREEETNTSDDERDAKMEDEESGSDDNENLYINSSGFYAVKKVQEKAQKKLKKKTKKSVNETPVNLPTSYTLVTREEDFK